MQQRLNSLRPSPIAFAHRGARAHAPENTLDAFALALKLGANGLETDAWVTRDGVVVLDHDGVVRRRGRARSMSDVDRVDVPAHVPTIDEFFVELGVDFELSIDVKDQRALDGIVAAAKRAGFDPAMLWLCFHSLEDTLAARRDTKSARIVDSTRLRRIGEGVERRASTLAEAGVDAINMHHTDWNGGLATLVHRFGLHAFGWDMQVHRLVVDALRMGLDAVYSDHVDLMVDAYATEVGHSPRRSGDDRG